MSKRNIQISDLPSSVAIASLQSLGTIGASTSLPSMPYSVATLTTTASTTAAITLPSAVTGQNFDLYVTNPASGTVQTPTFAAANGQTLVWASALNWNSTLGAANVITFECSASSTWEAFPITSGLGSSAPLQEQINYVTSAGAAQTIPSPLSTPYYTIDHYVMSANFSATLPALSLAGGESFTLWVDQPAGDSYTLTFVGSIRWVGGTAPSSPVAGERLWCSFIADTSINQWVGTIISAGF
jgi:hypothetical protein